MSTLRFHLPTVSPANYQDWDAKIEATILNLPMDCAVAEDCCKLINAADALVALAADVKEDIFTAVAAQCGTFYFG